MELTASLKTADRKLFCNFPQLLKEMKEINP